VTDTSLEVGSVVLAKAGRDKGKAFIVVGFLSEEYVLLADGSSRTIDKPKKKKIRHLDPKPQKAKEIQEMMESGLRVLDADIRKSLRSLGYEN